MTSRSPKAADRNIRISFSDFLLFIFLPQKTLGLIDGERVVIKYWVPDVGYHKLIHRGSCMIRFQIQNLRAGRCDLDEGCGGGMFVFTQEQESDV